MATNQGPQYTTAIFDRFQNFTPRFDQRLRQELAKNNLNVPETPPTPSSEVQLCAAHTPLRVLPKTGSLPNGTPAYLTRSTTQAPAVSPVPLKIGGLPTGAPACLTRSTTQTSAVSPKKVDESRQNEPTDLLSAFKTANRDIQNFFENLPNGRGSSSEVLEEYEELKTRTTEMLKKVGGPAETAKANVLQLFQSFNYLKDDEVILKVKQRDHLQSKITALFNKRFASVVVSLDLDCLNLGEIEQKLSDNTDPFELEFLRSSGHHWESFYKKLTKDKLELLSKSESYIHDFKTTLVRFLNSKLCVDSQEFYREARKLFAASDPPIREVKKQFSCGPLTPSDPVENLARKIQLQIDRMKDGLSSHVTLNRDWELSSVTKAINHACDRYEEELAKRTAADDVKLEDIHRLIYKAVEKSFGSVPGFEYTELWAWPSEEPDRIKQHFQKVKEEFRQKRVARIGDQATALLEQLEQEDLKAFWRERFPQLHEGGEFKALEPTPSGSVKRLAIEDSPGTSGSNPAKKVASEAVAPKVEAVTKQESASLACSPTKSLQTAGSEGGTSKALPNASKSPAVPTSVLSTQVVARSAANNENIGIRKNNKLAEAIEFIREFRANRGASALSSITGNQASVSEAPPTGQTPVRHVPVVKK